MAGQVIKTSRRTVVGLQQGQFTARQIIRQPAAGQNEVQRSSELAGLVPPGCKYAFDLTAYIGLETLLHGRRLQDVQEELASRRPAISISLSSLHEQQLKFLYYFGLMHQQATPRLRESLQTQPYVGWLIDGTLEPETPVFLGIKDCGSGIMLNGWKIPSESREEIGQCLQQAAESYGDPDWVVHDLSPAMGGGCEMGLPGIPHFVCHYHLARDVGEDIYQKAQNALSKRLRSLKLLARLREQRRGQADWLRASPDPHAQTMLIDLLSGRPVDVTFNSTLGREVLLAIHYWILDYRTDGQRRGYPFDPYMLYLHRRLVRASRAVNQLLANQQVAQQAPQVLHNFRELLNQYREDLQVVAAAVAYERACAMFQQFRQALRLSADQMDNLRAIQELSIADKQQCKTELECLRDRLRELSQDGQHPDASTAAIIVQHLDKYWPYLIPDESLRAGAKWQRTTNPLESDWNGSKRCRRRAHGRGNLSPDFRALPEEYVLIQNLENPIYVDLVLDGNLENLPDRFAKACQLAGGRTFAQWRRARGSQAIGKPPRCLLRNDQFFDHLIDACCRHCSQTPVTGDDSSQ